MGSVDGNFYRGNKDARVKATRSARPTRAFRGRNTRSRISETGTADPNAAGGGHSAGNVHAMWMGLDDMPYWSYSRDQGATQRDHDALPIGLTGTGFPVVVAGDVGTVAFGYVGETPAKIWTYATDASNETPLLTPSNSTRWTTRSTPSKTAATTAAAVSATSSTSAWTPKGAVRVGPQHRRRQRRRRRHLRDLP